MMKRLPVLAALVLASVGFAEPPSLALDNESLRADWSLWPDSTRAHPKKQKLGMVAPAGVDLVRCHLVYGHYRGKGVQTEYPGLGRGGKIKVRLQVVGEHGTTNIAKAKAKVETSDPDSRGVSVAWADSPVPDDSSYRPRAEFPIHLEPGNMLLWTVQFRGMPKVESERHSDPWYFDEVSLNARCQSCGSIDHPCPDDR